MLKDPFQLLVDPRVYSGLIEARAAFSSADHANKDGLLIFWAFFFSCFVPDEQRPTGISFAAVGTTF